MVIKIRETLKIEGLQPELMARSYNQDCILAYALDILGERWTLLIVRELFLGPRRFADLLAGLPGIGTNLLSKRLKELEGLGILEPDNKGPGHHQYRLSEVGEHLRPTIRAMMVWSIEYFLSRPEPSEVSRCIHSNDLNPDSIALAAELFAPQVIPNDADYVMHLHVDDNPYTLFYMNNNLIVRRGHDTPASAEISINGNIALQAYRGEISRETLVEKISATGREDAIHHVVNCMTMEGKRYHDKQTKLKQTA